MASINPLLRSQKNQVFVVIQMAKMNVADFVWTEKRSRSTPHNSVPALVHSSSNYYFQFDVNRGAQVAVFAPGDGKFEDNAGAGTWDRLLPYVQQWLKYLEAEINQPDLWESLASEKRLITNVQPGPSDDTPFSPEEIKRIDKSLLEIKEYMAATQNLSPQQMKIIEARLTYLGEAAQRMGRKDWGVLVVGILANIASSAAFAPSNTHELLRFTGQVLDWVFSHQLFFPLSS